MLRKSQKIYLFFKRCFDLFGSMLGIILLSPVLLIATIVTKCTSKGPVFFKQYRPGKNEKPFLLLKFRSMKIDAAEIPPEDMSIDDQSHMTTKWGHFMRKTSIDELPQLFNIFVGQMSFIGPRPSMMIDKEERLVLARRAATPCPYLVKPGLSGYAQIKMRRDHDVEEKAFYDSEYVRRMSFWFDLKIFVYSFLVLFGFAKGR